MRLHHYGLATESLERSAEVFRLIGYQISEPTYDPIQKVRVCFASREGENLIELVCDIEEEGPTHGLISRMGCSLYHICYEVDNMEEAIVTLRKKRYFLKQKPVEATAFDGKRIAWLYNRDIGLVEILGT